MRRAGFIVGAIVFLFGAVFAFAAEESPSAPEVPVKGMITMVDIGADKCIPCKMMAPILKELAVDYKDRAAIVFIDVWKDASQGPKFGIRSIPTQVFYDKEGKEFFRHEGFFDRASIVEVLHKAGVAPPESKEPVRVND